MIEGKEGYMSELYTTKQVAKRLGVTTSFIYGLIELGLLKARFVGKGYRFTEDDIQAYLDSTIVSKKEEKISD